MLTLKTTNYNRDGSKHLSTIRNVVYLNQLNQEVSHVLEDCGVANSKIKSPTIYHDLDVLLSKLKSLNNMIINKVSLITSDLNGKISVKRIIIEEKAAQKIKNHIITTTTTYVSNRGK